MWFIGFSWSASGLGSATSLPRAGEWISVGPEGYPLDAKTVVWDAGPMRILLVGASGTIGSAVAAELGLRHELITAGRSSGDVRLDVLDPASIRAAYAEAGPLDAVVSATGKVTFKPLAEMTAADFEVGLQDKLMGQVNLVLLGREHVADGGSFTLTGGVLDSDPIVEGSSASMVNGALNAFAMAAAIELDRGLRINVISPGVITEAMDVYAPYFRGFEPVPAARAALAYAKSVEGKRTGHTFSVV
jgi:NAD(P)-dependent dehydrogenase (short-subunit alcohol dehydrogenase family)